jgi:hypothetical protein
MQNVSVSENSITNSNMKKKHTPPPPPPPPPEKNYKNVNIEN